MGKSFFEGLIIIFGVCGENTIILWIESQYATRKIAFTSLAWASSTNAYCHSTVMTEGHVMTADSSSHRPYLDCLRPDNNYRWARHKRAVCSPVWRSGRRSHGDTQIRNEAANSRHTWCHGELCHRQSDGLKRQAVAKCFCSRRNRVNSVDGRFLVNTK